MGDFFEQIVDVEVSGEEAGQLAGRMVDWMVADGRLDGERGPDHAGDVR
ncbi:hypothetical protein [Streptomyces cavernicola]|uniref:Uncharacterized protein n=1 Tax=Streptomyces cavernicola TaxID=3043613 RepID=A0ABT6S535_9ACTN|nr:hypothetical protein [Streptomyces sp. B-S-A6]MDI3403199.1 hypothetical protein [Streptomyces sp. B-S-A6]